MFFFLLVSRYSYIINSETERNVTCYDPFYLYVMFTLQFLHCENDCTVINAIYMEGMSRKLYQHHRTIIMGLILQTFIHHDMSSCVDFFMASCQ